jgi:diketogulonate reductase-like aldo/keto reductase
MKRVSVPSSSALGALATTTSTQPLMPVSMNAAPMGDRLWCLTADVAKGVAASGIPRSEAFLTTKYQPGSTSTNPDAVYKSLKGSLAKIDPGPDGYIDLMLVHWSAGGGDSNAKVWSAFTKAQKEGWIKDVGVSNLYV